MNVPEKAIEAAREALHGHPANDKRPGWLAAVEAAAPFIAAQAWVREHAPLMSSGNRSASPRTRIRRKHERQG